MTDLSDSPSANRLPADAGGPGAAAAASGDDRSRAFYAFLIEANALLVRAADAAALYRDLCALAPTLDPRFVLAWVGIADVDAGEVRVVAAAGSARDYLAGLSIPLDPQTAWGQDPTARAIREGRLVVVNDFLNDPIAAPWSERAADFGIRAAVAIPLRTTAGVAGALMLYSSEAGIFAGELLRLLVSLGENISLAADVLREREEGARALAQLRRSESRYRLLAENVHDVIWVFDVDSMSFVYISPSVEKLRGFTPAEAMRQSLDEVLTAESAAAARRWLAEDVKAFEAGNYAPRVSEFQQRCRDGRLIWTEVTSQIHRDPEAGTLQVHGVTREITERRAAEMERRLAERRFRDIVELATEGIAMLDAGGRISFCNRRLCELLGYPEDQLAGRRVHEFLVVEDRQRFVERFSEVAAEPRRTTRRARYTLLHADGHPVEVLLSAAHLSDEDGGYQGSIGMVTDITELSATERRLREALNVVESSPVVGFRWRAEDGWPVDYVSANVTRWGYAPEDILAGRPAYSEIVHPDDLERVGGEVARHTAAGVAEYVQEYRLRAADGRYFWVEDHTRVVRDANGRVRCYEGVVTDVDANKRAEEELEANVVRLQELNRKLEEAHNQLLQSEKMASIGQLAAGVAHELNNPIGFVHSNLGTLDAYLRDIFTIADAYADVVAGLADPAPFAAVGALKAERDYDYLRTDIVQLMDESREGLQRVKKIVQDLKDFSRAGETDWEWADLHAGLESTLNIVWNELKYKCTVTRKFAPDLPRIRCLPSQLNQVFMNLLVNAAQAIEGHGEISITTEARGDDAVVLRFADNGKGIPPELLQRIFEPFFTTKPVGKGTGLGLSIAYGIIGKHRGEISVDSVVGQGTTFTIVLPVDPTAADDGTGSGQ